MPPIAGGMSSFWNVRKSVAGRLRPVGEDDESGRDRRAEDRACRFSSHAERLTQRVCRVASVPILRGRPLRSSAVDSHVDASEPRGCPRGVMGFMPSETRHALRREAEVGGRRGVRAHTNQGNHRTPENPSSTLNPVPWEFMGTIGCELCVACRRRTRGIVGTDRS